MKAVRKQIIDDVWWNAKENDEPMPDWLVAIAEKHAKPGTSFLISSNEYGNRLVPSGYYVIRGPTDIYPCSPTGFKASYEIQPESPFNPGEGADMPGQPTATQKATSKEGKHS